MSPTPTSRARRFTAGLLLVAGMATGGAALVAQDASSSTVATTSTTSTSSAGASSSDTQDSQSSAGFAPVSGVAAAGQAAVTNSRAS